METDYCLDAVNPRTQDLLGDFQLCNPQTAVSGWDRDTDADAVRFATWPNQSADCKKYSTTGYRAMPWEGASDQRVFLADGLVEMVVDTLTTAFWREMVQSEAVNADEVATAGVARSVLRYFMRNKMGVELAREVELAAQYAHTYGSTLLHVTWQREYGRRYRKVTLDEVRRINPEWAAAIDDPSRRLEAVEALKLLYRQYVELEVSQMDPEDVPEVSVSNLRRYVEELRENQETQVALPFVAKNQPSVKALRLWQDVFIPEDVGDIQRTPVFVREFLRVDEVMGRIRSMNWNRQWAEAACLTKGKVTSFAANAATPLFSNLTSTNFVEVLTAYTRRLDADEIPGVYVTTFCPHVASDPNQEDLVANHGLLEYAHGLSPFVALSAEWRSRSITQARGVPERSAPSQRMLKVERDSLVDRASITTLPPRLVPLRGAGDDEIFGPAAVIPVAAGREPKFMALPQYDGVSDKVQAQTRADVAWQFAMGGPEVSPNVSSKREQRQLNTFFQSWTEVFHQMWQLASQYMSEAEFMKVVGVPKPKNDEIAGRYGVMLAMDVRQLDAEYALKELEAISKHVLPEDTGGMIDRGQLMTMKLAALNPLLASRLVQGKAGASQKVYDQVAQDLAMMFLGNPPKPVQSDPTSAMQLQFAQQIIMANPKYQEGLKSDPRFAEMAKAWMKNRQQSVMQEKNKMTGRIGVDPAELQGQA